MEKTFDVSWQIINAVDWLVWGCIFFIAWIIDSFLDVEILGFLRFSYLIPVLVMTLGFWRFPSHWLTDRYGSRLLFHLRMISIIFLGLSPFLAFWSQVSSSIFLCTHVLFWVICLFVCFILLAQYLAKYCRLIGYNLLYREFLFAQKLLFFLGIAGGLGGLLISALRCSWLAQLPFPLALATTIGLVPMIAQEGNFSLSAGWLAMIWSLLLGPLVYNLLVVIRFRIWLEWQIRKGQ